MKSWTVAIILFATLGGEARAEPVQAAARGLPELQDCGASDADADVVVCGRRSELDKYRLPPSDDRFDPYGEMESVSRQRHRLMGPDVAAGIGSCSTVGPGGWTGCDVQVIKRAEQQGKRVGVGSVGLQVGRTHVKAFDLQRR